MKNHLRTSPSKWRTNWRAVASILVLVSVAATSCGDSDDADQNGAADQNADIQVFSDDDIGADVVVDQDEQFEIRLASTPSTGYAWQVSAMTSPDLVELEDRTHISADSGLVGAAGTDVFVFAATGEGAGVLRLEYIREFDDPIVPERVAEFIIRIDGAELTPPPGTPPPTNTAVADG